MTNPPMILCGLEVITKGAAADVRLNDIPTAVVGMPGGAGRAFVPVPHNIVRGFNRLAARVAAIPGREPDALRVEIRIAVFQDGDDYFSGAGQELASLAWAGPDSQTTLAQEFTAPFGPVNWSWANCATWTSPAEALADAMPFVRKLATAFYASDADWLERASPAKFTDMALAFTNLSLAEMKARVAELIRSEPPETAPTLPPQPALCCGGRLLQLLGRDGESWFKKGQGPSPAGAEILLGKLNGSWQIIR